MSRIGKKPIPIPEGVKVSLEGKMVIIKGPKGELQREIRPEIKVELHNGTIVVSSFQDTKQTKAFWGLTRALLSNMVKGVTEGYEKKLQMEGIGYKAALEGEDLVLQVGFSHPVRVKKKEGITFLVEKNSITVSGIDKELVGRIAASIRAIRPPEPYKGKGIRYDKEIVRRKAGKRAVTAAT